MTSPPSPSDWRRYFQATADRYDEEVFTRATDAEVAELVALLDLPAGSRLLDVGCGTGRHAVPLALAGFRVTGVDLSPAMLARAAARAWEAGVELELVEADARELPHHLDPDAYDAAVCLCEGAFGLFGEDVEPLVHDRAILAGIHRALRPGGKLVLTGLSGARMLAAWHRGEPVGAVDLLALTRTTDLRLDDGSTVTLREHYHLPDGLRTLAELVGFEVEAVWAGGAGDWRREAPHVEDYELMLVARRQG
jgi:SAM-dependent methyltransferase